MEIELLRKHGMSLRKIAEEVGCAVNTVRSHLKSETWPGGQRHKLRESKLSAFSDYLRERQQAAVDTAYSDFLEGLLKAEAAGRNVRKQTMLTRLAGFPVIKTLDDFDYEFAQGVKSCRSANGMRLSLGTPR